MNNQVHWTLLTAQVWDELSVFMLLCFKLLSQKTVNQCVVRLLFSSKTIRHRHQVVALCSLFSICKNVLLYQNRSHIHPSFHNYQIDIYLQNCSYCCLSKLVACLAEMRRIISSPASKKKQILYNQYL